MDKLRKHQRAETGVYLAHNQFDQYEEGSVVRSPDSNILKKVEELFGDKPWAQPFVEARFITTHSQSML